MKKATFVFTVLFALAGLATICSCNNKDASTPATTPTLYDSLGGTAMVSDPANPGQQIEQGRLTIRSVVDSTIFVIAADNNINGFFKVLLDEVTSGNTSGFEALSKNLTDFVAVGTGAKSYSYTGLSMHDAHDPSKNPRMTGKVQNDDFDSFEADLVAGAAKNGIMSDNPALQSLAKIVESLRTIVVQG
ncbi:MAG TPA: hypothetical protein VHB48_10150 [Chitinophagaceae bacterium]|nr:hypothetical protein [Chitinophagaceae bacterium]